MTELEQAARQALKILENHLGWGDDKTATALREALGENNGKRNLDGTSEHSVTDNDGNSSVSIDALANQQLDHIAGGGKLIQQFIPVGIVNDHHSITWIEEIVDDQAPIGAILYALQDSVGRNVSFADETVCICGDIYPADSFGAGFIAATGRCQNCCAAEQAEQEPFDMDDHPPHRLCECRKCMEYFTPLPDCDAFAAFGKPIAGQTNTQLMEGYRIGLAEMREKCAKVVESGVLGHGECAAAIRAINFEGDTGFRPVSEMIAEHKQDPKKAAAIEKAKMRKASRAEKIAMPSVYEVPVEQAEQEPMFFVLTQDHTWLSISEGKYEKVAPEGRMKAYAAPVRTKDLTDFGCVPNSNGTTNQRGELLSALEALLEDYIHRVQDAWIEAGGSDISREEVLTNCEPARNAAAAIANMTGATDELP